MTNRVRFSAGFHRNLVSRLNLNSMRDIISLIVVILIIGWLVGYFGFGDAVGSFIHILLVLAVIGILYRLATGRRP